MNYCEYIKDFTREDVQDFFESMPGIRCRVESVEPAYIRGHKVLKVESELGTSYFTDFGIVYAKLSNGARSFTISSEYLAKPYNPIMFRQPVGANGTDMFAYSWTNFVSQKLSANYLDGKKYNDELVVTCKNSVSGLLGEEKAQLEKKIKRVTAPQMVKFIKSLNLFSQGAKVGV